MVRPAAAAAGDSLHWDPNAGTIDAAGFEGLDAVVHLAGTGIGDKRWTPSASSEIVESRVGRRRCSRDPRGARRPPGVLVSGSAVGWYGNRGSEVLTEASAPPSRRLPRPTSAGSGRPRPHAGRGRGHPHGHLRTGIVLATEGGVLPRLLLPFKLGLGGRIGSGEAVHELDRLDDEIGGDPPRTITTPSCGARQRHRSDTR